MVELKLVLKKDITDIDIQDNIQDNTTAILTDGFWWIEILNDNSYFIPNGWTGIKTNSIEGAIGALNGVIIDNTSKN